MKKNREIRPYGAWDSPLTGESMVQSSLRLGQIQVDGDKVFWTEGRPNEKGRTALMRWSISGTIQEYGDPGHDVRTRAHEYGGGAFLTDNSRCFYINNEDQQIYEVIDANKARQITDHQGFRYADLLIDEQRNCLFAIAEDHARTDDVQNMVVRIPLGDNGEQYVIAGGHDFYANPQLSPDGSQLLFITWDLPDMPWDSSQLWLASLDEKGNPEAVECIAGGENESIFQPLWDPDGSIYFVSDRSNWWNLYHYSSGISTCILKMDAEFGLPQWVFGMSTYTILRTGELVATYRELEGSKLIHIDVKNQSFNRIDVPYSVIDQVRGSGDRIAFLGYTDSAPGAVVSMNLKNGELDILQRSSDVEISIRNVSQPKLISFESHPDEATYAWYYPPCNPDFEAPQHDKPPLIVLSHGGPTAYSSMAFSPGIQFWTLRGFAVVDVNYSGSTGFGRAYRERLKGTWGIRDVEDCAAAAQHLVREGEVDPDRLIIKGSSAGGYTTLAALTFSDVFKAGASYYGVGDLTTLAQDTHKFESRYLDQLVGPYPEAKETYIDRSPLNHADQLKCPVIFLQGLEDPVVPPEQAESMVAALKQNRIPVAYLPFGGESHGFRRATTIVKAIESEYAFYMKVFGITPSGDLEAVEIFNLD